MIFHISALPRSGTAWIASVLNLCPDIMCVHEPVDGKVPVPEKAYRHNGQSGSHLLMPNVGRADLNVYIQRDPDECYNATSVVMPVPMADRDYWNKTLVRLATECQGNADVVIFYENLFTIAAVRYLWETISDEPFEQDKVAQMIGKNVQRQSLEYEISDDSMNEMREFLTIR